MDTQRIVIFAIGGLSLLTNGILLLILYLDPLKKFRTTTSYLIISLTISDFLTGGIACAYAFGNPPVIIGIFWATILNSIFTVFFMSCERLVVVVHPFKAKRLITKSMIRVFIAASWLVSSVLGGLMCVLQMSHMEYLELVLFSTILIFVLVLVVMYFAIIWHTKHKPTFSPESKCNRGVTIAQHQRRLTGVLLLLVAVLMATVVPYLTVMAVFAGYSIFSDPRLVPNGFRVFSNYYFPVELLNFVVNPIIYAWRLQDYRQSLYFYFRKSRRPGVNKAGR